MSETVTIVIKGQSYTGTVTTSDIAKLRRMVDESGTATYTDAILADYVKNCWLNDDQGYGPESSSWTPAYDLCRAASEIWTEKAAALSMAYDQSADGAELTRSQMFMQAKKMAMYYTARMAVTSFHAATYPRIPATLQDNLENIISEP